MSGNLTDKWISEINTQTTLRLPEPRVLVNFRWLISQKLLIKVIQKYTYFDVE